MQKKGSSIGWNHKQADPEFGAMQARELQYHMQGVLQAFPAVVRVGKGYVEVCHKGIDKGIMAERAVEIATQHVAHDSHGNPEPLGWVVRLAPTRAHGTTQARHGTERHKTRGTCAQTARATHTPSHKARSGNEEKRKRGPPRPRNRG